MKVFRGIENLPAFKNAVVTIGTFDGVHLAHQKLIARIKQLANETGGESVILTFDPHPRQVLNPGDARLKVITTLEEKIPLLEKFGVDNLVVAEFSPAFSQMLPEEYISHFLVSNFHPAIIVIGYNHRFGRNRSGDIELLRKLKTAHQYDVELITKQMLDEMEISSTHIREALLRGDMKAANTMLGHPYQFSGKVVEGDKRGRTIGYPTANVQLNDTDKMLPMDSVYAVRATINGDAGHVQKTRTDMMGQPNDSHSLKGMMNIGFRPTVDGKKHSIEVHLFDFDQDIYGKTLTIEPVALIRHEQKFNGLDELKQQLRRDKDEAARALLN